MSKPTFKDFIQVANAQGISFPASVSRLAMDADPQPVLPPNGGIPAIVSTFIDPTIVETLFSAIHYRQRSPSSVCNPKQYNRRHCS